MLIVVDRVGKLIFFPSLSEGTGTLNNAAHHYCNSNEILVASPKYYYYTLSSNTLCLYEVLLRDKDQRLFTPPGEEQSGNETFFKAISGCTVPSRFFFGLWESYCIFPN